MTTAPLSFGAEAGTTPVAVEINALTVRRGKRSVFSGLDLTLLSGRVIGLLGPSGTGKTTLIRAVMGIQKTQGGSVTVLGAPAGSMRLRRTVAYSPQGGAVYDDLSVAENLNYFARILGVGKKAVTQVQEIVGLPELSHQRVGTLSGGQRGRVSLATALLGDPDLLVLDEPTTGLDPILRESLWGTFRNLAEAGKTLIVSSHVMEEAMHADQIVLIHDGQVLANETPKHFLERTGTKDPDSAFLELLKNPAINEVPPNHVEVTR